MPLCPHCDFGMTIDLLPNGAELLARWLCMRCSCLYSGDGRLQLIAVQPKVCDHTDDIGTTYA